MARPAPAATPAPKAEPASGSERGNQPRPERGKDRDKDDKDKDKDQDKGGNDVGLLPDLDLPSAEGLLTWFADFLRFLPFV